MAMSVNRILFENVPSAIIQLYLKQELNEIFIKGNCGNTEQDSFLYFSLAFSFANVIFGLIMALYNYLTWRNSMLGNLKGCVPLVVKSRKRLSVIMHDKCRVMGNFVDSISPEVFLSVVREILEKCPYTDIIEFERCEIHGVSILGSQEDWKQYFN